MTAFLIVCLALLSLGALKELLAFARSWASANATQAIASALALAVNSGLAAWAAYLLAR
jgi:hypothetical protein